VFHFRTAFILLRFGTDTRWRAAFFPAAFKKREHSNCGLEFETFVVLTPLPDGRRGTVRGIEFQNPASRRQRINSLMIGGANSAGRVRSSPMRPARILTVLFLVIIVLIAVETAAALNGQKPVIRFIVPSSAAAGTGQLITIQGFNMYSLSNRSLTVVTVTQKGVVYTPFLFQSPSTANELYVRLPDTLVPGAAKVTIQTLDDNLISAPFSLTITAKPQPPILRKMMSLDDFSTITQASPGEDIGVQCFGTDTGGGTAVFTQGAASVTVASSSSWSGAQIGLVSVYTVPSSFVPGPAFVQIKLTSAHGTSKLSFGLFFTVVSP
jgi:hypothetical protein